MMNRHSRSRSRAREMESRQPQEDGRQWSAPVNYSANNAPRSPRPTTSSSAAAVATPPPPPQGVPSTPHSAPPPSSFPKTRCYRLNLERPFDIQSQKSPLGRDYSGPPVHDSDLPPAQGPVEYLPPPHLCSKEELAWRRHSWGGGCNGGGGNMSYSGGASMVPSELLENLHVSVSEESNAAADPTSIAISTARIFRGIVVDRNGVITSMNPRAMRSQMGKGEAKNKMGEKSRQAAKIDKAKDLIDEVAENGGAGNNVSEDENDPTKIVSLFVMGEYEDLNDLVRDGSKKLRDSKTKTDEDILRYNRPRIFTLQPMAGGHQMSNVASGMLSPNSSHYNSANILSPYGPESTASSQSAVSNIRKRVFSSDKPRAIYHKVLGSTPKIKSSPRDTRAGGSNGRGGRMGASPGSVNSGYHAHHSEAFGCNPLGSPLAACDANKQQHPQQQAYPNYFQQQCNFFPGNADWTEVLGFSVNSLWNCGANGDLTPTMSPHSNPSSPRGGAGSPLLHQQQHGAHAQGGHHGNNAPTTTGGGVYHGSGETTPTGPGYHGSSATGYGGATTGYHHQHNNNNGGFSNYNATSPYRDEGRNPSYGYGRGSGAGVRDTVVL